MKANEIDLKKDGYLFSAIVKPARSHYKELMRIGRVFPTTKAQAIAFIKMGVNPDIYNMDDVEFVEKELSPYGFVGEYRYTKSRRWVRLVNIDDVHKALKLKYDF